MRAGPILVIAALVTGGACTGDSRATTATTVPAEVDAGGNPIDLGRLCVHTDPAQLPISVHRALSCPDGTTVSVSGIVTHRTDGSTLLCDSAPGDSCLTIDDSSTAEATGPAPLDYSGTVSKGVLTVVDSPEIGSGPVVLSPINRPSSPLRSG